MSDVTLNESSMQNQKPIPPVFPEYDEKYYLSLAEPASDYMLDIDEVVMWTATLAASVIGLVICWIPIFANICLLLYRVGARRRDARDIYLKQCHEIEFNYILQLKKYEIYSKGKM